MQLDAPWDEYVDLAPGPGLARLAGYVVEDSLQHSGLVPADPQHIAGRAAEAAARAAGTHVDDLGARRRGARAVVEATYERLAAKGLAYRSEALDELGDQVIRPWSRVQREGGTCLDLALIACGQLLACDLRPLLAVAYGTGANHAVVIVDLDTPITRLEGAPWPAGVREALPGERVARWVAPSGGLGDGWLVYDPTRACGGQQSFDHAQAAALEVLGQDVQVVDVEPARRETGTRRPPAATVPGLLSQRCPPPPPWLDLETRERLVHELLTAAGTTVLRGARGVGKSVVALEAVQRARHGAGWFLNGSSKQALMSSLAEQEAVERGLPASQVALDVEGYARAALGRLQAIDGPWWVVVDNADLPVADVEAFLPVPDVRHGQHLVVTTAGAGALDAGGWEQWAAAPGRRLRPVLALLESEAIDFLERSGGWSTEILSLLDGKDGWDRSPLLLRALGALARREVAVERRAGCTAQQAYWKALRSTRLLDVDDLRLARVIALLPPVSVPSSALAEVAPPVQDRLAHLQQLGLLTRARDEWSMHGTLADAVRGDLEPADAAPLAVVLLEDPRLLTLLASSYDAGTVERLRDSLEAASPEDAAAVRALGVLLTVVDQRGTAEASAALATIGLERTTERDGDLRAVFLLGAARFMNQHTIAAARASGRSVLDAVQLALVQAREAQSLATSPDLMATSIAMQGLLTQKKAQHVAAAQPAAPVGPPAEAPSDVFSDSPPPGPGAALDAVLARASARAAAPVQPDVAQLELLHEAERLILQALEMRQAPGTHPVALAKAEFNVCGNSLQLAKAQQDGAAGRLAAAREAYRSVGERRRALYGTTAHRHVASCTAGEGMIDYYTALLLGEDADARTTTERLRRATDRLVDSLAERERLEPTLDEEDVVKSLQVLAKAVLLRLAVAEGTSDALLGEKGVVTDFFDEVLRWVPMLTQQWSTGPETGHPVPAQPVG